MFLGCLLGVGGLAEVFVWINHGNKEEAALNMVILVGAWYISGELEVELGIAKPPESP